MIIGIGTDIVEVERIERSLARNPQRFAQRILSENEYTKFKESKFPERFLAKRFAAKEAFAKALGTGIGNGLNLCDIELSNSKLGKPVISYIGNNEKILGALKPETSSHISISDEKHYAIAFVVIEKSP